MCIYGAFIESVESTSDALIVLVRDKLAKNILEDFVTLKIRHWKYGIILINFMDINDNMKIQSKYQKAVDTFLDNALDKYGSKIDQIILFGSVARGEARKESDIDVLVVWKGNEEDGWRELTGMAFDILLETREYISIKVVSPSDFETENPFLINVMKEGIQLA
jgi:uncharacterized protein